MKIKTRYYIEIKPLPIGHPYYKPNQHEIYVHGFDNKGQFHDLYYCQSEDIEKLLEYINSDLYVPSGDLELIHHYGGHNNIHTESTCKDTETI